MITTTKFKFFEEKKHSVRYNADPAPDVEPNAVSVYVNKTALTKPYPQYIMITISTETA